MVALQHKFDQRMLAVKYDGVFCVVIGDSEAAKSVLGAQQPSGSNKRR